MDVAIHIHEDVHLVSGSQPLGPWDRVTKNNGGTAFFVVRKRGGKALGPVSCPSCFWFGYKFWIGGILVSCENARMLCTLEVSSFSIGKKAS